VLVVVSVLALITELALLSALRFGTCNVLLSSITVVQVSIL